MIARCMRTTVLLGLFHLLSCSFAQADIYTLQPGPTDGKDTGWGTVYAGNGQPDDEFIYTGGWGDFYYNYFEFNLSSAPPSQLTTQATITFWMSGTGNDPQLQIHRITQPWTESGVTRQNNPTAVFVQPFGSQVLADGYYTVDITQLYKNWKDGVYPNHGIKLVPLRNDHTGGPMAAAENADVAKRPRLTVTYVRSTSPNYDAKILIHLASTTTPSGACSRAAAQPSCAGVVTQGDLSTPSGPHKYFAYLLVADGNAAAGIGALQCGISYNNAPSAGVDVLSWTNCATLEFTSTGWPAAGGGNLIAWDTFARCQRFEPGGAGTGVVAVAGYFYCAAYSPDFLTVTPRPVDGQAKVADCSANEDLVGGTGFPPGLPSQLGYAAFSAGAVTPGYSACVPPPCSVLGPLPTVCSWAARVVSFDPGTGTNETTGLAALSFKDGHAAPLGLNGSIVLALNKTVQNLDGPDFVVYENGVTHNAVDENFRVEASVNGIPGTFIFVGEGCGGAVAFDLAAAGLDSAAAIKITDISPYEPGASPPNQGADIDAVEVVHCGSDVDLDGDGLLDDWEVNGVPTANGSRYTLPGADPNHKDLYVEIDAMTGLAPDPLVVPAVEQAFASMSQIDNPNGVGGIALHLLVDEQDLSRVVWPNDPVTGNVWPSFYSTKSAHFGTTAERATPDLLVAKANAYRYCVFVHNSDNNPSPYSGRTEDFPLTDRGANDFMVSLGRWGAVTWKMQAGTFMHELGHALGLLHGGGDGKNYKPNYRSVMNYIYQMPRPGWQSMWGLFYSNTKYDYLDEYNLDETTPIAPSTACMGCKTPIGPPEFCDLEFGKGFYSYIPMSAPYWNCDLDRNDRHEARNINNFLGTDPQQLVTEYDGFNDLANLVYLPLNAATWSNKPTLGAFVTGELTEAESNDLNAIAFDCNHNGVSDRDDIDTGYSQDKNQDDQPDECETAATAIELFDLEASWNGLYALVTWRVVDGFEATFYVYRRVVGPDLERVSEIVAAVGGRYEYSDPAPPAAGTSYWVLEIARSGERSWHGPADLSPLSTIAPPPNLGQNHPNPVMTTTKIQFAVPEPSKVSLRLFSLTGQLVATLIDGEVAAGSHTVQWDRQDQGRRLVAPGLYFYRLTSGSKTLTRKLLVQ